MSIPSQISNTLTSDEQILYNFEKPFSLKAPGLIFTNKRLICYKSKHFGSEKLKEYRWRDVQNISIKEGLVNGEIEFEIMGGHEIEFKDIPKSNLREMYSMARELKEKAAISSKPIPTQTTGTIAQEDPVSKLKQLKDMLDSGLITQEEYDKTKAAILARM